MIHTQPSATATAGQAFGTQPVVYEEDQYGNLETGDNSTVVTASLASGTGPLQGTTTVTVSGGVATFTNLADNKAETISLNFTSGSLTECHFHQHRRQPGGGQPVGDPHPAVADGDGRAGVRHPACDLRRGPVRQPRDGRQQHGVTAALESGTGPLQGTTTVTVSGGVATFAGLADNTAETITLQFTSGSLTSSPTSSIVVSPATASQLVITHSRRRRRRPGRRSPLSR